MERKGIRTVKGDINRRIQEQNDELHRLQAELERVNAAIAELNQRPQEENLVSILMRFYGNGEKFAEARGLKLGNLKKAQKLRDVSQAVAFLQGNHISTMTELSEKHATLESEYCELKDNIIARQKRIKVLHDLLDHYEIFKTSKAVYDLWKSITNQKKKRQVLCRTRQSDRRLQGYAVILQEHSRRGRENHSQSVAVRACRT